MLKTNFAILAMAAALTIPSEANAQNWGGLFGPQITGKKLEKRIEKASKHALGSEKNPVRAEMPMGQRSYLRDLRCADGKAPIFRRIGNAGFGVFGNIVDVYDVRCKGSEPASSEIWMDMYHTGYVEVQPVPGFTSAVAATEKDTDETESGETEISEAETAEE